MGVALATLSCAQLIGIDEHSFGSPGGAGGRDGVAGNGGGTTGAISSGGRTPGAGHGNAGAVSGTSGHAGRYAGTAGEPAEAGSAGASDPDYDPPSILSAVPAPGERGVAPDAPVVIRFDEPMNSGDVDNRYSQRGGDSRPAGAPLIRWTDAATLSVLPGLDRPRSVWEDDERPGTDAELEVTVRIEAGARDLASNGLTDPFESTFYLARRVEHRFSPCAARSGTATLTAFEPLLSDARGPCLTKTTDSLLYLAAGDRNGEELVAVVSYELGIPSAARLVAAMLELPFDGSRGDPSVHGPLLIERVEPSASDTLDAQEIFASAAFDVPVAIFPLPQSARHRKDVTPAVAGALATGATAPIITFRLRFGELQLDQASDYVLLDPPLLELVYDSDD